MAGQHKTIYINDDTLEQELMLELHAQRLGGPDHLKNRSARYREFVRREAVALGLIPEEGEDETL